jgi:hypothetical protein
MSGRARCSASRIRTARARRRHPCSRRSCNRQRSGHGLRPLGVEVNEARGSIGLVSQGRTLGDLGGRDCSCLRSCAALTARGSGGGWTGCCARSTRRRPRTAWSSPIPAEPCTAGRRLIRRQRDPALQVHRRGSWHCLAPCVRNGHPTRGPCS